MRRVVHVGPLMAPGGMASVIKLLAANPPEGWRASSCNTFSRRGSIQKLRRWQIAKKEIKTGDFDLVHIHCAAGWSYKRKISIAKVANAPCYFPHSFANLTSMPSLNWRITKSYVYLILGARN